MIWDMEMIAHQRIIEKIETISPGEKKSKEERLKQLNN